MAAWLWETFCELVTAFLRSGEWVDESRMCGEACVADGFLPWVFEVFVPTLSAETRGRMRELLCDTASFVVRLLFDGAAARAAATENGQYFFVGADEANVVRLADDSIRNMQIPNTDELR